ncbi:MAG: hypothetical protein JW934_12135 [Anaerolineae bacterium]|nr:hypothetical protein [Anaerolineae bacterium]
MAAKIRPDGTPYNILEQNLKRLGTTMLLFSIYDLIVALLFLVWPQWFLNLLDYSGARYEFRTFALVHLLLPCFCMLAWMDPKRNIVIVTGAIMARVMYTVVLAIWILIDHVPLAFAVFGGISLLFAALHYLFLRRSDFGFWEILSRAGNPPGVSGRRYK